MSQTQFRSRAVGLSRAGENAPSPQEAEEAFIRLITKYDRALFRYIMTLHPKRVEAEEIHQETAAALWRRFGGYDASKPFLPWAYRFAYFEVLRFRKKLSRDRLVFTDETVESLVEEYQEEGRTLELRREALSDCLARLNGEDRLLIQRRYASDLTVNHLATERGVPVKRLYNALDRVRRLLLACIDRKLLKES